MGGSEALTIKGGLSCVHVQSCQDIVPETLQLPMNSQSSKRSSCINNSSWTRASAGGSTGGCRDTNGNGRRVRREYSLRLERHVIFRPSPVENQHKSGLGLQATSNCLKSDFKQPTIVSLRVELKSIITPRASCQNKNFNITFRLTIEGRTAGVLVFFQ